MVLLLTVGPAIAAYVLIVVLMPVLRRYALARPNARSSHHTPTPQGAGIAVIVVLIAMTAILAAALPEFRIDVLIPVLAATGILALVGAIDDIWTLEVIPRLAIQSLAVIIVIATLPHGFQILPVVPTLLERGLMFVALLWFVNLMNFMDGIDWMTVAETVNLTAALAVFGMMGALPMNATAVALGLCGSIIGFAPLNRPVARVFLGDVGSLPLGLLLGWLLLLLAENHLAAAILLPLYYVSDATLTLLRRLTNGERVMQAHRSHFYQRAMNNGLSASRIVGRVALLNLALAALAALTLLAEALYIQLSAVFAGCLLVAWTLHSFQKRHAPKA